MEKVEFLLFLKPGATTDDAIKYTTEVLLYDLGLEIVRCGYAQYDIEDGAEHYIEHKGKPFLPPLLDYVTSGPIYYFVLKGDEKSIAKTRAIIGSTIKTKPEYKERRDELEALLSNMSYEEAERYFILPKKGTLRCELAKLLNKPLNPTKNFVHCSDSPEAGIREISVLDNALAKNKEQGIQL